MTKLKTIKSEISKRELPISILCIQIGVDEKIIKEYLDGKSKLNTKDIEDALIAYLGLWD